MEPVVAFRYDGPAGEQVCADPDADDVLVGDSEQPAHLPSMLVGFGKLPAVVRVGGDPGERLDQADPVVGVVENPTPWQEADRQPAGTPTG